MLWTRRAIIQVINNIVITTLETRIPAFTSFRARDIRAHYNISTLNMSRTSCTAGPCPDSVHKSILPKPLLQEKKYFREPLHASADPRNRTDVLSTISTKPAKVQLLPDSWGKSRENWLIKEKLDQSLEIHTEAQPCDCKNNVENREKCTHWI